MDTLSNIEKEVLRLCISHESEHDDTQTDSENSKGTSDCILHLRNELGQTPHLILRVSNDKKFRNSSTDLIISAKDLEAHGLQLKTLKTEDIISFLNDSMFVKDLKLNAACTEVAVKLERKTTMTMIFKEILTAPVRIKDYDTSESTAFVFVSNYGRLRCDDVEGCFSYARLMAISTHLKNILELNGIPCYIIVDQREKSLYDAVQDLSPDNLSGSIVDTELKTVEDLLMNNAQVTKYRLDALDDTHAAKDVVVLDFETYLLENGFETGRNGFDKNLKSAIVVNSDNEAANCLKTAAVIERNINGIIKNSRQKISLLMVSPVQYRWEAHMSCICWRMLSSHRESIQSTALCCCGRCSPKYISEGKVETVTFHDYLRQKSIKIRESYQSRYGSEVQGGDWDRVISDVVTACIRLDLLSSPLKNVAHLNVNADESHDTSSRDSIFVLYNYSRLCTLLRKYKDEQIAGRYPPLPSVDEIDFSNLREEQEWRIFVKYILSYPILMNDLFQAITDSTKFLLNPSINKIASFLSNLARDISSYYHQTKVLLDPMPHLFPLMFARIYFIQVLQKVMQSAFKVIGINPPTQM